MTDLLPDADIVVRHCAVRVVRRGGWSWGPEPDRLPQRVADALPSLLAARFAEELSGDTDVEITEPVTIDVSIPLADLIAGREPAPLSTMASLAPAASATHPASAAATGGPMTAPAGAEPDAPGELDLAALSRLGPAVLRRLLADRQVAGRAELDRLLELLPEESLRVFGAALADVDSSTQTVLPPAPAASSGAPVHRWTGEAEVRSALPFLLAPALARIGLLDAIGPALAGAELVTDAPLFATALAYKVLGPLERGWLRSTSDRVDAAAFAGLAAEVPDDALVGLARRAGPALPVLDGLVGLNLCRGHEPGRPLLLAEVREPYGSGLLLVEPDGLFPIAWADEVAALLPYWDACGRPLVLLAGSGAALAPVGVRHTRALVDAGVPLGSDAAPSRGERWRRMPGADLGPVSKWMTGLRRVQTPPGTTPVTAGYNTGILPRPARPQPTPGPRLAPAPTSTQALATLTASLDELVGAMAGRRAVPLAEGPAFERTVTLIAAVALGTIAWLLWRHREPPDPQLTLARLGDLSGLVRFDRDAVRVRLPLGRRHADLQAHGLLADVPEVVWLGGRTLTFSGG